MLRLIVYDKTMLSYWLLGYAGALTLVLDLGSLLMESDAETPARLPAEAAALYQCLRLTSRDISAYLVDGTFSFAALERAGAAQARPVRARMLGLNFLD